MANNIYRVFDFIILEIGFPDPHQSPKHNLLPLMLMTLSFPSCKAMTTSMPTPASPASPLTRAASMAAPQPLAVVSSMASKTSSMRHPTWP